MCVYIYLHISIYLLGKLIYNIQLQPSKKVWPFVISVNPLTCLLCKQLFSWAPISLSLFQQGARRSRTGPSSGRPLNRAKKTLQCASQRPVSGSDSSLLKAPKSSPSTTSTCATAPRPWRPLYMPIDWLSTALASRPWTLVTAPCPLHPARGILATHLLGLPWWSTPWPHPALPQCGEGTKWRPRERHLRPAASSSICCRASLHCTAANPTSSSWGTAWRTHRHQSKCRTFQAAVITMIHM